MWDDAAKNSGHLINQLNKALDQELAQNGNVIKEIMSNHPTAADTPCADKMDFINAVIKQIKKADQDEMKEWKDMTMMSAAGSIVKGAAGVAAQGARAVLPTWVSQKIVGPAPPKAEPPKVMTLTSAAAEAGNPEALNFQKLANKRNTEDKTAQQNPPPSHGRVSQD